MNNRTPTTQVLPLAPSRALPTDGGRGPPTTAVSRFAFRESPIRNVAPTWEPRVRGPRRRAFDATLRDHRDCILSLANWMGFGAEDAEDIAQEALLALFVRAKTGEATTGALVDSLAARSLVARRRSNDRQAHLDSAVAQASVATRSERDNRGASWLSREGARVGFGRPA